MTMKILQIVPCTTPTLVRSRARTETDDGVAVDAGEEVTKRVQLWALVEDLRGRRVVPMIAGEDTAELEAADESGEYAVLVEEE